MDAPLTTAFAYSSRDRLSAIIRCAAAATILSLFGLSLLFIWRCFDGRFEQPLEAEWLFVTSVAACCVLGLSRARWKRTMVHCAQRWLGIILQLIAAAATILFVYSLISIADPRSVAPVWIIVIVSELISWLLWSDKNWLSLRGVKPRRVRQPATAMRLAPQHLQPSPPTNPRISSSTDALEIDVVQQITRTRGEDGSESLFGSLRSDFDPQQRTESLHIAFCPPLACAPQVVVEQTDGPAARLKVAQVESFGARIDVRLAEIHAESASVVVEFFATSNAAVTQNKCNVA